MKGTLSVASKRRQAARHGGRRTRRVRTRTLAECWFPLRRVPASDSLLTFNIDIDHAYAFNLDSDCPSLPKC